MHALCTLISSSTVKPREGELLLLLFQHALTQLHMHMLTIPILRVPLSIKQKAHIIFKLKIYGI